MAIYVPAEEFKELTGALSKGKKEKRKQLVKRNADNVNVSETCQQMATMFIENLTIVSGEADKSMKSAT